MNYVWCTTSVLGKGATGAVFQGVNRNNGEPVAVKTFNQMSHMRPMEVQMREFEVIKKVNHENIVKLLAIEDDQEGRGKVIVMELCTGGSLFNILDDPENTYGLPQEEFLLVVEHLSAGMKHLRDNNLVHRDLKPGNIMKFISEDGKTVYKLTDFGAARELEDNQPFMSLYGTEEYLHPDMYERAVLRKSVTRTFTANVDLWSIGVTLYHVATGNLPFRPYGGRKNRETMHLITTKKASGVISGTQLTENGPIEWSRVLPPHCRLSQGLKSLVTPLLAGLLEENREKMWSFDRFFQEVTNILSKRVLHIFYINRTSTVEIYLESDDTLYNLREHIHLQTNVAPENQILLLCSEHFEEKVGVNSNAKGYPPTERENPIFLYSRDNNNVLLPPELELPKFPTFPNGVSVENDASLAKVACSVGHECRRRIEDFTNMDVLIQLGVDKFTETLKETQKNLISKTNFFQDLLATVLDLVSTIAIVPGVSKNCAEIEIVSGLLKSLKEDFTSTAERVLQLFNRFVIEESLSQEWRAAMRDKFRPSQTRDSFRAKYLVERLRDSWQHLLRDRATRTLTYNDEQFHALEKIKIASNGKRIKSLLTDNVQPNLAQIAECLADWYKLAQTVYVQTQILEKDVRDCDRKLRDYRERLLQVVDDLKMDIEVKNTNNMQTSMKVELRKKISTLTAERQELNVILQQNHHLIDILQSLLVEHDS